MPTKYDQNISKGIEVIEPTNFCLWMDARLIAIFHEPCRSGSKIWQTAYKILTISILNGQLSLDALKINQRSYYNQPKSGF